MIDGQYVRAKRLIKLGADIDYRHVTNSHAHTISDITALHYAIWAGHEDIVELLLETRANFNATSKELGTPLCLAVLTGQSGVVKTLLEKY